MLDQDFDKKVRLMLEDAVEEVPEGVWEGVSGALDKAAGKKKAPPVFWWRMFGGVAAAAAAVLLGVFLWPGGKGDFSKVESQAVAPVAVVVPTAPDSGTEQPVAPSSKTADIKDEAPKIIVSSSKTAEKKDGSEGRSDNQPVLRTDSQNEPEEGQVQDEESRTTDIVADNGQQGGEQQTGPRQTTPVKAGRERIRYVSEDSRRAGALSLSLSGNAFATGRKSVEPGVTRLAAPAKFRAPVHTGITPVSKETSYGMPFTVGLGVKYYVLPRFAVGTGVNYTLLTRSFVGTYNEVQSSVEDGVEHSALVRSVTSDVFNDQHYIGVPVSLFYDFVQTGRVRVYVRADGMVEKNVRSHYRFHSASEPVSYVEKVRGVQWSAGAGLGLEVRLGKYVGIYADPGVRYYFKGNQPASLRTAQPLMVDINAGVRFNIN